MTDLADLALSVDLGANAYAVRIGYGLINRCGPMIAEAMLPRRHALIVADAHVAPEYAEPLIEALRRVGIGAVTITVPAGEESKSWAGIAKLCDDLLHEGVDRSSFVIALGGGVIGDLAGFAAGIILRGIPFIQIPTSLLAQVDSSVGGKTGINVTGAKNMVGLFHQPRLVLADLAALETLPSRELRAGYGEVVKHALINDAAFFAWLEANGAALLAGDADKRQAAVAHSVRTKAAIVAADEREGDGVGDGMRALLNLGHTFAHALEVETDFDDRLRHGEAVAIGLVLALETSARLGIAPAEDAARLAAHLQAVGMAARIADIPGGPYDAAQLVQHMGKDKKKRDGRLTFVVLDGIGKARLERNVPMDLVRTVMAESAA